MSNMNYCRFENTLIDFKDCLEHFHDKLDSRHELEARRELASLCIEFVEELNDFNLQPEDLGTDSDPNCAVECRRCGEPERAGMIEDGLCEECFDPQLVKQKGAST